MLITMGKNILMISSKNNWKSDQKHVFLNVLFTIWVCIDICDAAQNGTKKLTSYDKITNERRVYILPLVNYNVYWPLIGQLYSMTSFFCTILRSIRSHTRNIIPILNLFLWHCFSFFLFKIQTNYYYKQFLTIFFENMINKIWMK